jgi:hypothetical protein
VVRFTLWSPYSLRRKCGIDFTEGWIIPRADLVDVEKGEISARGGIRILIAMFLSP